VTSSYTPLKNYGVGAVEILMGGQAEGDRYQLPGFPPLDRYRVYTNLESSCLVIFYPPNPPYQGGKFPILPLTKGELEGVMQNV
jgi:hypothetical protein